MAFFVENGTSYNTVSFKVDAQYLGFTGGGEYNITRKREILSLKGCWLIVMPPSVNV
jgi:hypothetical protein